MISQVSPWLDEAEIANVADTLRNNWITEGPKCAEAIEVLNQLLDCRYVTFAPNGTLGLFLGLLALDLPVGSEVLVPDFTFFGSCSAIVMAGLTPVTVDIDISTFQMDLDDLRLKIGPNASAIMPVHIYGQGSNICEIIEIAKSKNLKVIEDAAQVLGVNYSDSGKLGCQLTDCCSIESRSLGTFGDVGVFSLYADKTLTSGEGGIICCKNEETYEKLKLLRNQGRPNSGTFIHPAVGMNFRITDLQGAILLAQLDKLSRIKEQRTYTYELYQNLLEGSDITFMELDHRSDFIPFRVALRTKRLDETMAALNNNNIQVRRFFHPMHKQPALEKFNLKPCFGSSKLYETGLCLPIHRGIKYPEVKKITDTILKIKS
jgi:perosamine synthetase